MVVTAVRDHRTDVTVGPLVRPSGLLDHTFGAGHGSFNTGVGGAFGAFG